ncbi:hypothetical protein EVAR_71102_1 [Eumeta japonica]|uniref:Uncharacterized protein n=1 Tax=Eumeta variegata TaxID=151549 RepID=A0A4C1SYS0_EUMVA|nr:hypothetical protein EVAR_71102_1 [Eumeta japonica]
MTRARMHHPKASTERTMLPRCMGGRGLVDINNLRKQQIEGMRIYFMEKSTSSSLHNAVWKELYASSPTVQHISTNCDKLELWKSKPLHGRHPNEASKDNVDNKASNHWLVAGCLFPETEGFMIAIQDQVIPTRNYLKAILRDTGVVSDSCRYGCNAIETIQHITSGCTCLAGTEYIDRHNSVVKMLHQQLALMHCLISSTQSVPYYKYEPEPVLENSNFGFIGIERF